MQYEAATRSRQSDLDTVVTTLLSRTSRLTRVLMRAGSRELSRTEAGLLMTLQQGDRSISELADSEALAQPSVSKLVDRLEARRLVGRHRDRQDGRVVLVSITPAGAALLHRAVDEIHAQLRSALSELPPEDLSALVTAGDVLERLVHNLQHVPAGA